MCGYTECCILIEGLVMSIIYPVLAEASFNCKKSGETFLPDAGQRSRANIPGDDPGIRETSSHPDWRGFNPDRHVSPLTAAKLARK
jgi:hypothetical protein